jgi:hypothetical protein
MPLGMNARVIACGGAACIIAVSFTAIASGGASAPADRALASAEVRTAVRLSPRADVSRTAWSTRDDTYDRTYVYPLRRELGLNSCGSTIDGVPVAKSRLAGPSWQLEPLAGQASAPIGVPASVGRCSIRVGLPALGRWRIRTSIVDGAGATTTDTQDVTFRDVVVAAVGDSFASGEGNKLGGWVDGECHRSFAAWPQVVARSLENATTSVTFLSLACTGAGIEHLVDTNYSGAGGGPANLRPQLKVLRSVLGSPLDPGTRSVDVLLANVGINALPVGRILEECSLAHPFTHCRRNVSSLLAKLPALYDRLELGLTRNVRLGAAYFVGYPARIFTDSDDDYADCGVFAVMDTPEDDQWIDEQVSRINTRLAEAAARHSWSVVQTRDLFRRHGYCADETWFRSRESSQHGQGNDMGTAHPNLQGHRQTARHVLPTVRTDTPVQGPQVFDVRLLRMRVTDKLHVPWPGQVSMSMQPSLRGGCGHLVETATGLQLNVWNDLSANPCTRFHVRTAGRTVRLSVSTFLNAVKRHDNPPQDEQQGPGQPTSARPGTVIFALDRFLRRADGWDASPSVGPQHEVKRFTATRQGGHVELEYEITRDIGLTPSR